MGLRDELQVDIAEAFDIDLADAITTFTCSKEIQSGDFDFETQTYPTVTVDQYSGRGVFGSYKRDLVKPIDYQVEDVKATVLQNEVSGVPQIDDVWMISKGQFKVLNVEKDPSESIWICQLRKV
ncbi:glutamate 5-kinase [Acinetobacter bereziniae]|uniref:glutamate 5-kinase n=1 Tax=Acinetobacter bereziniae TaxID=106648 RepID=UPI0019005085|nr:glutamate 5-kinase [Acinetobacter bereziniae]MBJ9905357.1 glutamate 5-kinase [Acinetobacter bereziniae]MCU4317904.1 glutamate 5-kinase [Acinetobacter bereziniae]MCU4600145.1 glutamate 5-kinase [Acinetobacter bereziniae]